MKKLKYILLIPVLLFVFQGLSYSNNKYAVITLNGSVNPVVSEYIVESIEKAQKDKNSFIVLQMDTPGGLMSSMRNIIKSIFSSSIPVIVYTFPRGAQAASAGGFIMLSAHVAAMSPGSEIGAMHPVSPMLNFMKKDKKGSPSGIMEKKVLNDTIAYAKSLAQKRKRNVSWAENAVKKAISNTYKEALQLGVIDLIAEDMGDLLKKLNNRKVNINGKVIELKTDDITASYYRMDWKKEILNYFADPQIIFILLIIAVAGIGIEFKSPGMIFPGVLGAISLLIFLLAIQVLPINLMGLLLMLLAIVLFVLELSFTSYGLLTLGGIASFVLGSMILFDSPLPGGHIPLQSIIASLSVLLGFIFIVVRSIIKTHKKQVTTGRKGLIGETGYPVREFNGKGKIKIHGEIWNATSDEFINIDDEIVVTEVKGMSLVIKKYKE